MALLVPHRVARRHRAGRAAVQRLESRRYDTVHSSALATCSWPVPDYHRVAVDQPPTLTPTPPSSPMSDPASLRRIYDEHGAVVYRFCSQTLPAHLADEATQDVFVQAWRNRDRFDPNRGSMVAWLIGIAKLRVIDIARREQRHSGRRADLDHYEHHDQGRSQAANRVDDHADAQVDRLATKAVVASALQRLPERQRQVVALAYVEGLTHQEISTRTATPLGTVKSDIRRGLQTIRQHVESADV